MKKILVPVDFSKNSLAAVEYASAIARKQQAAIILLNVYHYVPPARGGSVPDDIIHILRTESDKKLKALCSEITRLKKIKCEYLSQFDLAVNAILETSVKKKTDLIVMGTKGASGIKEMLMGSNTASVIEKAKCPVIAVPEGAVFGGIKNILYASNYNESDLDALKKLAGIARLFKAGITVLHVSDEEFNRFSEEQYLTAFRARVQQKIKYEKLSFRLAFGEFPERVIQHEVEQLKPGLIALSTQHRNLIEKIFGKSVTKKMAFHSQVPLMAFHHKKESVIFV